MNQELIQKLIDAGFPIETDKEGWVHESDVPTLSELIEACGEDFGQLMRNNDGSFSALPTFMVKDVDNYKVRELGDGLINPKKYSNPEIAVANLWLE